MANTYFLLGVDHILTGFDHLMFVLALILLISDRWILVKTITAFTVAHSITLAGATLGYVSLPQKPVEATIALSIAFVASELVKARSEEKGDSSEDYPWIVASRSVFFTALVLPARSRRPGCRIRISPLRSSHSIWGLRLGSSCSLP